MTRCAVGIFASRYRPSKSTAARGRAFGAAAGVCGSLLLLLLAGTILYIEAAVLK